MNRNSGFKKEDINIETDDRFSMERVVILLNLSPVTKIIPKNGNLLYRCPLCGDSSNPSNGHLYIDLLQNSYYCAKCGECGKSLSLYSKANGIDNKTAFKELLGADLTKTQQKKIYNVRNKKKEMKENKKCESEKLAGIKRRDIVYRSLLLELELTPFHRDSLLKRGLTDEFICEMQYKSIPQSNKIRKNISYKLIKSGLKLSGIPGFFKDKDNLWTFKGYNGFLIPVLDNQKRIQGFQIRRFVEKGKYIWFSSSGENQGIGTETFVNFTEYDNSKPFVIVEGILKSQVCSFLKPSANYVGVPGTFAIKFLLSNLIDSKIKNVFIAFDMDKLSNPFVQKAENKLKIELSKNNISFNIFNWDINKGKGLDDYLYFLMLEKRNEREKFIYCG